MVNGKKKYGLVVTILVLFVVAGATVYWLRRNGRDEKPTVCVTPAPSLEVIEAINKALTQTRQDNAQRPANSVTIPVHFHIITNASGSEGDVTNDAVNWQIAVLNAAFSGTAGPVHANPADTPFRFSFGSIERIKNDGWFNMAFNELTPSDAEKQAMARNIGGKSALNIYTAKLDGVVSGWARVPFSVMPGASPVLGLNGVPLDGVVLRYSTLPGALPPPFDEGDTATHEAGHWLGLLHVFQFGCVAPGDAVTDTTLQAGNGSACSYGADSCSGPGQGGTDPVENFMNTTSGACMFKFTKGQSSRMDYYHMTFRT